MKYAMRAEFKGNVMEDFSIQALELPEAKLRAEGYICQRWNLPFDTTDFDWRGQVVFVNQGHGLRV